LMFGTALLIVTLRLISDDRPIARRRRTLGEDAADRRWSAGRALAALTTHLRDS
jgi:hypothetical protein